MIFNICYGIGSSALLALAFYIFCFIKKINIPQKILSVYIFLSSGIITSLLLSLYLPDARHIFIATIISYIMGTIGFILSLFPKNKICRLFSRLSFLIVAVFWISIYYTTFYLYHIAIWVNVISAIFYTGVLITIEILLKNKSITVNFWIIISLILVSFLNYCGLITLCFNANLSSSILFAGTFVFLLALIYFVFEYGKEPLKYAEPTKLFLLTFSQILISTAGVLIFAL